MDDIGVKMSAEGSREFQNAMRANTSEVKSLNSALKEQASEFDKNDKSAKNLTQQNETMSKAIEAYQSRVTMASQELEKHRAKMEQCKQAYEDAKKANGDNSAETKKAADAYSAQSKKVNDLQDQINKANTQINGFTTKIKENTAAMAESETKLLKYGQNMQKAGKDIQSAGEKVSKAGDTLTKKVSAPLVAVGTASVKAFEDVDAGMDTVIKKTGATGDSAKGLESVYTKVAGSLSASKADFSDVGNAVGELNTRFGFTGDTLETASEQFLKFASINGVDVNDAVRLVSRAMGDANIPASQYNTVLDELTAASQQSGISIDVLTESITKYGAPMRALGFDTQSSISIFAEWEKAGVNTETAFSGMKKAIGNWTKQGKDAKTEFGKLVKGIQDGSVSAQKAISVFGTKGGEDMVDAIQNGRFNYEEFMKVIQNSGGVVENTFAKVTHPADQMKQTLHEIQLAGSDLGGEIMEQLAPKLTELGNFVKDCAEKFKNMSSSEKDNALQLAGWAIAAGPILSVSGKLISTTGKMISGVGTVTSNIGGLTAALKVSKAEHISLSAAAKTLTDKNTGLAKALGSTGLKAGLAVAAITAVGIGFYQAWQKAHESQIKFNSDMDSLSSKAQQTSKSFEDLHKASAEAITKGDSETDNLRSLSTELDTLVDANGRVKSGQEDRVNYILSQLNPALGLNMTAEDGIIQKYDEQKQKIGELIAKKQAEMELDAHKSEYEAALQKQSEALKAMTDAQSAYNEKKKETAEWQEKVNNWTSDDALSLGYYKEKLSEATQEEDKAATTLGETSSAYGQCQQTIQNYSAASAAIQQGNYKLAEEYLSKQTLAYTAAGHATEQQLSDQVTSTESNYEQLKAAYDRGDAGVTETMVKNAESLRVKAKQEYAKTGKAESDAVAQNADEVKKKLDSAGAAISAGAAASIANMKPSLQKAAEDAYMGIYSGMELTAPQLINYSKDLGINMPTELANSLAGASPNVRQQAVDMILQIQSASDEQKPGLIDNLRQFGSENGLNFTDAMISQVEGQIPNCKQSGADAADATNNGANGEGDPDTKKVSAENTGNGPAVADQVKHDVESQPDPQVKVEAKKDEESVQNVWDSISNWFKTNPIGVAVKSFFGGGSAATNANGGKITDPTLTWVAEGGYSEYIIPTDPTKRARSLSLMSQAATDLGMQDLYATMDRAAENVTYAKTSYNSSSGMDYAALLKGIKKLELIKGDTYQIINPRNDSYLEAARQIRNDKKRLLR